MCWHPTQRFAPHNHEYMLHSARTYDRPSIHPWIHHPVLETEKETIEKTLYSNPSSDFTKVQKLTEKLAELTHAIDSATERWLELAERV